MQKQDKGITQYSGPWQTKNGSAFMLSLYEYRLTSIIGLILTIINSTQTYKRHNPSEEQRIQSMGSSENKLKWIT